MYNKNFIKTPNCYHHCIYKRDAKFKAMLENSAGIIFNSTDDGRDIFSMDNNTVNSDFILLIDEFFNMLYDDLFN